MALVNQYTNSSGLGNANYALYKLASLQSQKSLNCNANGTPASGCIFNDVASGTIAMPCAKGSPNCTVSTGTDTYGVLSGYTAGTGYDLATGLGSVNAYNLANNWILPSNPTSTTLTINNGKPVSITHGQSLPLNVAVTPTAATGYVSLIGSPSGSGSVAMGMLALQNGAASGNTATLAGGNSYAVKAHYAGDTNYAPSDSSPVTVTVTPEASKTLISIPVFNATTGNETGNTPVSLPYGSPYIERVDVGNANAAVTFPPQSVCAPSDVSDRKCHAYRFFEWGCASASWRIRCVPSRFSGICGIHCHSAFGRLAPTFRQLPGGHQFQRKFRKLFFERDSCADDDHGLRKCQPGGDCRIAVLCHYGYQFR